MRHNEHDAHKSLRDTARLPVVRMSPRKRDTGANVLAVAATLVALACFLGWLAR